MDIKLILENQLAIMRAMQQSAMGTWPELPILERQIQFTEQRIRQWERT